jgi:hypothetical protein
MGLPGAMPPFNAVHAPRRSFAARERTQKSGVAPQGICDYFRCMLAPVLRSVSALLCTLASVYAGTALEGFSPVKVGEGPLVYFVHPEDGAGGSENGARTEVLYLCEPAAGAKAVPVWRGKVPLAVPLQRLTENLTVLERNSECYLWDLAKGGATPLWPGENQTSFLKAEGGKVFFLRRLQPETLSDFGMKLGTGKTGKIVAEGWFRPRDKVCTFTPGDPAGAVELTAPALEHIVEIGPAGIWAVTADEPRKLCFIFNDGTTTEIAPFDQHWVARETHAVFSPARDYLALSVLHDEQDFHSERELVVVDVKRKAVSHVSHNVSIDNWGAYPAPVRMNWVDGTHLLFGHLALGEGKNEQVLEASSGNLSAPTEVQCQTAIPSEKPARERRGLFDSEFGKIWFAGDKEPAGSILDHRGIGVRDLEISKDGKWAAYCDPDSNEVFLLDGANRRKPRLMDGWAYGIKWLAAVNAGK